MSDGIESNDADHRQTNDRGVGQFIVYALIVLAVIGAGVRWRSQQEVRGVRISGILYIKESEVRSLLDSSIVPSKMADVHLNDIRLKVMSLPYVRNATVQRVSENEIEIRIQERHPKALVVRSQGDLQYIDEDAVLLPYRLVPSGNDVPIIRGVDNNGTFDTTALRNACSIIAEMSLPENGQVINDISELKYDSETKSYSFESSAEASKVLFGSFENSREKVSNLCSYFAFANKQNDPRAASLIDLRWAQRVFVTRKS